MRMANRPSTWSVGTTLRRKDPRKRESSDNRGGGGLGRRGRGLASEMTGGCGGVGRVAYGAPHATAKNESARTVLFFTCATVAHSRGVGRSGMAVHWPSVRLLFGKATFALGASRRARRGGRFPRRARGPP